ncbi:hypothetical protein PRIPAC_82916 [Pristionchus pacificus]|uniref:Uncharacterized protein n=1 Tax=Pristionchus pacificus TaxID=54126 RepID=A0A454XLM3_PRIPA|nr:hypothetical protein PRIPAC_82916 [Pristionchus pacificus]|eukprot:PDM78436.1 hypothetical protein PRIPAC_31015 [Pristionchus pacificus]
MASNVIVKVLLLIFVLLGVTGGTLHERAEEQRRKERVAETADIAIDVLYKTPPTVQGYVTFVDVALVSFGFVLGATALLAYRLAIPKKCDVISAV